MKPLRSCQAAAPRCSQLNSSRAQTCNPENHPASTINALIRQARVELLSDRQTAATRTIRNILISLGVARHIPGKSLSNYIPNYDFRAIADNLVGANIERHQIIFLTGHSGIGKTSLSFLLSEKTGRRIIHLDRFSDQERKAGLENEIAKLAGEKVIVDGNLFDSRWFPNPGKMALPWGETCLVVLKVDDELELLRRFLFTRIICRDSQGLEKLRWQAGHQLRDALAIELQTPAVSQITVNLGQYRKDRASASFIENFPPLVAIMNDLNAGDVDKARKHAAELKIVGLFDLIIGRMGK